MEAAEQQNISSLNEARKNQMAQNSDDNEDVGRADSQRKMDFSEFLMWETGLTIFWLTLGGWIPFWGGVINVLLIGVIYIWYASRDLNPPSFSPAKIAKLAPITKGVAKMADQTEDIVKKIPGGGTLLFILAVLSGGVGVIPTPMVLFFSIYLANKN